MKYALLLISLSAFAEIGVVVKEEDRVEETIKVIHDQSYICSNSSTTNEEVLCDKILTLTKQMELYKKQLEDIQFYEKKETKEEIKQQIDDGDGFYSKEESKRIRDKTMKYIDEWVKKHYGTK